MGWYMTSRALVSSSVECGESSRIIPRSLPICQHSGFEIGNFPFKQGPSKILGRAPAEHKTIGRHVLSN